MHARSFHSHSAAASQSVSHMYEQSHPPPTHHPRSFLIKAPTSVDYLKVVLTFEGLRETLMIRTETNTFVIIAHVRLLLCYNTLFYSRFDTLVFHFATITFH